MRKEGMTPDGKIVLQKGRLQVIGAVCLVCFVMHLAFMFWHGVWWSDDHVCGFCLMMDSWLVMASISFLLWQLMRHAYGYHRRADWRIVEYVAVITDAVVVLTYPLVIAYALGDGVTLSVRVVKCIGVFVLIHGVIWWVLLTGYVRDRKAWRKSRVPFIRKDGFREFVALHQEERG